ncbi:MAG: histidinol-phosphate aminotransferase family protein [Caldilineaceae bacterium]|nr:histidinol-phosphate aminotransferase family protein [Caldilineaceae bacterium]
MTTTFYLPTNAAAALLPVQHGALDYAELEALGLDPDAVVDFSSNSNPYAPHPAVVSAVRAAANDRALARYPDRETLHLCRAIAQADGYPPDHVLAVNGAAEAIQIVALTCVAPGSRHLILTPTFGEYARAIRLARGYVYEACATGPDLRHTVEQVYATVCELHPHAVWLCNPNNPTGQFWTTEQLAALRAAAPHALWIIDEAYRHFSPRSALVPNAWLESGMVVLVRSLTKDHGLAGLRLGYILAAPPLIAAMRFMQPPWSVNSLAQAAGIAALQPELAAWLGRSLAELRRHAHALWAGLNTLGLRVLPTATTYALVAAGHGASFRRSLLARGIQVRDAASFGLPAYVRIAARTPEDNLRLLQTISAIGTRGESNHV